MNNDKEKKLFETLEPIEFPIELNSVILNKINTENKKKFFRKLLISYSINIASLLGIISTFVYLIKAFISSEFYKYISLIFSDGISILSYWREFIMSVVESLPITSITTFLFLLGVFLWSIEYSSTINKNRDENLFITT